ALDDARDLAVEGADLDVDLGQPSGQLVRGQSILHPSSMTLRLSRVRRRDTLVVMSAATTHRFDLTDQTITCYLAGPGRGSGGGVDRRMWGPQLSAYPERTVIAPDARGHGGSSDADGPPSARR